MTSSSDILVVGGGLAGMAAAMALAESGQTVTLIEARRNLGGRASSFRDVDTGQAIDFCQHVSLGCCTNLADFCQRVGIADEFERIRTLHFIGPGNEHCQLTGSSWLPAPLHMLPVLWGLKYLSVGERFSIARSLRKLSRCPENSTALEALSMQTWLEREQQSPNTIDGFWRVVLVSALSEDLPNISVASARKVFVEGFMASRHAYEMLVPKLPLGELYGERLSEKLKDAGITLQNGTSVSEIEGSASGITNVRLRDNSELRPGAVILAVPWRHAMGCLGESLVSLLPEVKVAANLQSASITGVHLWFDRPITDLHHAVLVNRISQWLFKPSFSTETEESLHYYQIVISASGELSKFSREEIISHVLDELHEVFPTARDAQLKKALVVTERHAVFSPKPGTMNLRPGQKTSIPNLFLAGDWTTTDWPATMEGAVRSGFLAAERVCAWLGTPKKFVVPSLRRGVLAKLLIR